MIEIERIEKLIVARLRAAKASWADVDVFARCGWPEETPGGTQLIPDEVLKSAWVIGLVQYATNVQNRVFAALDEQDPRWLFRLDAVYQKGSQLVIAPLTRRMAAAASRSAVLAGVGTSRYPRERVFETNAVFVYLGVLSEQVPGQWDDLTRAQFLLRKGHLLCGAEGADDRNPVSPERLLFF